jgi:formamidopyrimidine-DNA glycosylase
MPELPEVETVRRGLAPVLVGARIERAATNRPDLRFPLPNAFSETLEGARIRTLDRWGKYLLARLENGPVWVTHLGMSGSFRIAQAAEAETAPGVFAHPRSKDAAHDHVVLDMAGGARVTFNDPRRFGYMTLVDEAELPAHPLFARLGLDGLDPALDGQRLATLFAGSRAPLKAALLDQRRIAGLGNIYVSEALHRAGLSPLRAAGTLAERGGARRANRLAEAIRAVLAEAIEAGGSTLRDHVQANGELGYFQHRFRAYGRTAEPCSTPRCKGHIERVVQAGRSTFFCARCQR